jgi:Fe2+ transport system protein B
MNMKAEDQAGGSAGIYSMSPYTQEEVISRDYLVRERPDAIINVVDSTTWSAIFI